MRIYEVYACTEGIYMIFRSRAWRGLGFVVVLMRIKEIRQWWLRSAIENHR